MNMQLAIVALAAMQATGDGLVIKEVLIGKGPVASSYDVVRVHYTGKLTNGKVFDTSRKRNQPYEFVLGTQSVIKGWDVGIAGMRVGGKRKLIIPPKFGYGDQPQGDDIPANSTLVFEVELAGLFTPKVKTSHAGSGDAAAVGDSITFQYVAKASGKKFDSTYDGGTPMTIQLGRTQLPPGLTRGLIGVKKGEKRTITIPPEAGLGKREVPGKIPGNSILIFEVAVLSVTKA